MLPIFQSHDVSEHEVLFAYFKMPRNRAGLKVEVVAGHTLNFLVDVKNRTAEFPQLSTDKQGSCVFEQST